MTIFERGVAEMKDMVTNAEKCRKFLEKRFEGFRIDDEEQKDDTMILMMMKSEFYD